MKIVGGRLCEIHLREFLKPDSTEAYDSEKRLSQFYEGIEL